jgi:glycosyltransferase involved in cell wall biosynthesis
MLGGSRALARAIRADMAGYDVCHMHGIWDQCLVAVGSAARAAGRPYLISPHGMLDRWSMARSRWKKRAMLVLGGGQRFLDGAAGVLFGTADEAEEATGLATGVKRLVMPNGVDPALLSPRDPAAVARMRAAVPQSASWARTLLFYSRFHPKKGLDLLIDAFAAIAPDYPDTGLLAAGIVQDPAYAEALQARAAATGLGDRLVVTAALSGGNSHFLLDAAQLFILPSHQEGFSMAIIEAMARATPVLITDRCHLPEAEQSGAGRTVAPTVAGLEQGLRDLLARDGATLAAMGEAGRALVADHYTWPQIARRLTAVYEAAGK